MVFPPEIGKTIEGEALQAEEILAGPNTGQLHGHFAVAFPDVLVEHLEVEGVFKRLVVQEIIHTHQPGVVDWILARDATVVFHLKAQRRQFGVLPKIQATGNFQIGAARRKVGTLNVLVVIEIGVYKEIGVTPFVALEHFERQGGKLAVGTEIVEHLHVHLRLGSERAAEKQRKEKQ